MKRILPLIALAALWALPAHAADPLTAKKEAMVKAMKQETIALGDNRFLIFVGSPVSGGQYGYTVDIIKIEGGIPHYEDTFMEDYDVPTDTISFSDGVAFPAVSYHFDKASGQLDYTNRDVDSGTMYQFRYVLAGDTFTLHEVMSQPPSTCEKPPCKAASAPPKVLYAIKDGAKKN